jgi:hypothetical protein
LALPRQLRRWAAFLSNLEHRFSSSVLAMNVEMPAHSEFDARKLMLGAYGNRRLINPFLIGLFILLVPCVSAQVKTDRELDGLMGPVKSTHVVTVSQECAFGQFVEQGRSVSDEQYEVSGRLVGNRNRFEHSDPISRMLYYPFEEGVARIEKPVYWEGGIPTFWKHGALIYTDVYTCDNQNRRSEHLLYSFDGVVQSRSIVIFDVNGRLAETKTYDPVDVLSDWTKTKYDERGNEIESDYFKEDGTLVEVQRTGCSYLNKFVYTYEFDSMGNWVEQVISMPVRNDSQFVLVPYIFKYRTISYYRSLTDGTR